MSRKLVGVKLTNEIERCALLNAVTRCSSVQVFQQIVGRRII